MTRDETVALFLQGRKAWNAWAEQMLAERKALEAAGRWSTKKQPGGGLEPKNEETRAWMEASTADFSRCLFLVKGAEETKETTLEQRKEGEADPPSIKSIQLEAGTVDFEGFIFPGDALFGGTTFEGPTLFGRTAFTGRASFGRAAFTGPASFGDATFTGPAQFQSATVTGDAWFENATFTSPALFEHATFTGDAQFSGAAFKDDARFNSATFTGDAWFESATFIGHAWFAGARFAGLTWFESTTFTGDAHFERVTFSQDARFGAATFIGDARFDSATFSGIAGFGETTFSSRAARFADTTFSGKAEFYNATFSSSNTMFYGATFSGITWFMNATFENSTTFGRAKFLKEANFMGIKAERAFDMTGAAFTEVPAFNQADLKQPPDLDDVRFPLSRFWRAGDAELVPQYRALRRMAIQGADYEREQMAYKGELRARRWTVDKWWSAGTWIGLFYDAFADCGRSIVRPANAWLASILLFAAFYRQRAAAGVEARCAEAGGAMVQALFLSVKNALVIFGGTRDARVNQAYLCLYNGSAEQPHIPPTVTFVETLAQIPVSATLIFLFLLAVKNRFKIK